MTEGWVPEFEGQRPPFESGNEWRVEPGNALAVKHGAYSRQLLEGDAEQLATEIAGVALDATSPVISLAGLTFAQVVRAERALRDAPEGADLNELKRDAHRWHARLESMLTRLGLLASRDGDRTLVQVNVAALAEAELTDVEGRILRALEAYPDARDAVIEALAPAEVIDSVVG